MPGQRNQTGTIFPSDELRREHLHCARAAWRQCLVLLLLSAGSFGCKFPPTESPRWNVILIVVDTLRADHLRFYGYDRSTTPFLEEFSRDAVIFEEARSQAGCTFPSVNSLLTSKHAPIFLQTMKDHGWGIPENIPTLAEMLQEAGYATGAVSSSTIVRVNPSDANPYGGFGAGFSKFHDDCQWKPAECVNEQAFAMLGSFSEPFFLYLHYFDPHMPYLPPSDHERVFAAGAYPKSWVADGRLLPLNAMLFEGGPAVEFTDEDLAHAINLYDEEILYFDHQFAQLVERLKTTELLDHTLLILASDHGEEFLEHGHIFHCRDLTYDTVMKTPLVFWIPGVRRSGSTHFLAQNLDIVPTILDYLNIDGSAYDLAGKSLRPVIEKDRSVHRYVFGMQRYARSVTDGRFKLSQNIRTGEVELFDLQADPGERTNMIARRPELADELTEVLMRWVNAVEGEIDVATRVKKASEVTARLRALGYL